MRKLGQTKRQLETNPRDIKNEKKTEKVLSANNRKRVEISPAISEIESDIDTRGMTDCTWTCGTKTSVRRGRMVAAALGRDVEIQYRKSEHTYRLGELGSGVFRCSAGANRQKSQ